MEKDSPSKPSVAELAGRFKGHILPMPTSNNEPPLRRRPPCSLKLQPQKDDHEDSPKTISPSNPLRVRSRNSALIEKLQANLALSPTALSPDVKPTPLSPSSPQSPATPLSPLSPSLRPPHSPSLKPPHSPSLRPPQSSEEEEPVGFETPAEGSTLPSFNKTRARLSIKRRPPTRLHRRSAGEEPTSPSSSPPCELTEPDQNGLSDQVFHSPTQEVQQEVQEMVQMEVQEEVQKEVQKEVQEEVQEDVPEQVQEMDRDCDTIGEEVTRSHMEEEEQQNSSPPAAEAEETEENSEETSGQADDNSDEAM